MYFVFKIIIIHIFESFILSLLEKDLQVSFIKGDLYSQEERSLETLTHTVRKDKNISYRGKQKRSEVANYAEGVTDQKEVKKGRIRE